MLLAYEDGVCGRKEVAEYTGLTVTQVDNAKDKLKRLIDKLPAEMVREARAVARGDV